jgi:hypothetical protein
MRRRRSCFWSCAHFSRRILHCEAHVGCVVRRPHRLRPASCRGVRARPEAKQKGALSQPAESSAVSVRLNAASSAASSSCHGRRSLGRTDPAVADGQSSLPEAVRRTSPATVEGRPVDCLSGDVLPRSGMMTSLGPPGGRRWRGDLGCGELWR